MLKQRVITALLLLPVVGVILFVLNLQSFAVVMLLVNGLLGWEWARLSGISAVKAQLGYASVIVLACLGIWVIAPGLVYWPSPNGLFEWHTDSTLLTFWVTVTLWLFAFVFLLFTAKSNRTWKPSFLLKLGIGLVFLAGFWVSVISLRGQGAVAFDALRGGYLVLFMLTIIWAADVGGYVFGKAFGKHKLAPSISPGKTWEGFFGGMAMAILVAFVGAHFLNLSTEQLPIFVIATIGLGVISVLGDLFESLLKRQVNLKDSSNLLPGHGGLLDRLDSTIAVTPFFLLVAYWLGWI